MVHSARTAFPGCPHHVAQRGSRRRAVFLDDEDRREFIRRLGAAARSVRVDIWAYALMSNHLHLIAVPEDPDSLSFALRDCLSGYAQAFDRRHGATGALWHGRSYASVIAPPYLWDAVRYVERNPVRAGIVPRAEAYPWSSAAYHCGGRLDDPLVSSASPLKGALNDWSGWLQEPDVDGRLAFLRRRARTGTGSGSSRFIGTLEHTLDRRILRRKRRPKRSKRR